MINLDNIMQDLANAVRPLGENADPLANAQV